MAVLTNVVQSETAGTPEASPVAIPSSPPKGYARLYNARLYKICYAIERIGGARIVPLLTLPFAALDILRRRRDYARFLRVRSAVLPATFWKSVGPLRHYMRMIFNWQETLMIALLYSRVSLPYWKKRFEVVGTAPQDLPEWGKRPVIVAFMHTGAFPIIRWYLRMQGLPTASLVGAMPLIIDNDYYNVYLSTGDKMNGVEGTPHYFRSIRDALRYLKPGRVLTMALDGGTIAPQSERPQVAGHLIDVKRGACRVAAQTGAIVMPISMRRKGWCRYEVHYGSRVPDELLEKGDYAAATQHLVSELWPDLEAHPENLNWTALEAFAPELIAPRIEWP